LLRKKLVSARFITSTQVNSSLSTPKPAVWSIQAETEAAASLFLSTNHVAVGWSKVGNLRNLKADRDAFKAKLISCYLSTQSRLIPVYASVLFQFAYRIAVSDLVVYPSRLNQTLYIGRIIGAYKYDPSLSERYPNLYPVIWLAAPSYSTVNRKVLTAICFPLAVSRIRYNTEDIFAAIANSVDAHQPVKA